MMLTFSGLLRGQQIVDVYSDSELTYFMLSNGTQVTIQGLVVVQPAAPMTNLPAVEEHPRAA